MDCGDRSCGERVSGTVKAGVSFWFRKGIFGSDSEERVDEDDADGRMGLGLMLMTELYPHDGAR